MKIISLFSGAGGLDKGFENAGFHTVWANEFDPAIHETFIKNFPNTILDKKSITAVDVKDIPFADGVIGGPPCQSWSEAGARRGIDDKRGKLFFDYIRILEAKRPRFFLAENVSGILQPKHAGALSAILEAFEKVGYSISMKLLNANDYGVPQDRQRVIIVGYHQSENKTFEFPEPFKQKPVLQDVIYNLPEAPPALPGNRARPLEAPYYNHEYVTGGFSSMFMSRNRVRAWDEPSFTIQAGARHAPLHPQAPKMLLVGENKRIFAPGYECLYRRLSVRECARIQTFPDNFIFHYRFVADGYKMIGNAVPVKFAECIARKIYSDLYAVLPKKQKEGKNFIKLKTLEAA